MSASYPSFKVADRLPNGYLSRLVETLSNGTRRAELVERFQRRLSAHRPVEVVEAWPPLLAAVCDLIEPRDVRERLKRELKYAEVDGYGEVVRTWTGVICPFPPDTREDEARAIIADLTSDLSVRVGTNGRLLHDPRCTRTHRLTKQLQELGDLTQSYTIELAYRIPPAMPVVRAIQPEITQFMFPDPQLHLLAPLKALCILLPSNGEWQWPDHGACEFVDYTAIWLAKFTIWVQTRARFGAGIWIGSAEPHGTTPEEHATLMLSRVKDDDPCHCGLGSRYAVCHKRHDLWHARSRT